MHIANWADHVNGASCSFLEVQEVSSVEKSFIRFKLLSSYFLPDMNLFCKHEGIHKHEGMFIMKVI